MKFWTRGYLLPKFGDNLIIGMLSILLGPGPGRPGPGPSHLLADSNRKHIKGDWLSTIKTIVTKFIQFMPIILTKIVSFITKIDSFLTKSVRNIIAGLKNVIYKIRQLLKNSSRKVHIMKTDWTIFLVIMGLISFIYGVKQYIVWKDETKKQARRRTALLRTFYSLTDKDIQLSILQAMCIVIKQDYSKWLTFQQLVARFSADEMKNLEIFLDKEIKIEGINNKFKILTIHAQNLLRYRMFGAFDYSTFKDFLRKMPEPMFNRVVLDFHSELEKISQAHDLEKTLRRARAPRGMQVKDIQTIRGIYECIAIIGTENSQIYLPVCIKHLGVGKDLAVSENLHHELLAVGTGRSLALLNDLETAGIRMRDT